MDPAKRCPWPAVQDRHDLEASITTGRREDQRGPRQGSGAAVDHGQRLITGNDREKHVTTCSR